jgi:hypothetical protein
MVNGDTLGDGENRAYVYDRRGETELAELPGSSIEWNRGLCEVSRASVVVPPARCRPELNKVRSMAHSVVIFRNGDRVWEGSIRKRRDTKAGLVLDASDVIGLMERRPVRTARLVTSSPVVTEMLWTITQGMTRDDPNVLANVQVLGGVDLGATIDRDVQPGAAYHAADLGSLTSAGGRYTALGRSIILWPASSSIGSTVDLSPENHLLADVEVIDDGDMLATEVTARSDDGILATAFVTDAFYGNIGMLVPAGTAQELGVAAVAAQTLAQVYPAPLTIQVPQDAALRCDAPFPMHRLVPGVLVPIQTVTATARTVSGTMVLTGVKVIQAAGSDETVGVTLAPTSEETG